MKTTPQLRALLDKAKAAHEELLAAKRLKNNAQKHYNIARSAYIVALRTHKGYEDVRAMIR